MSLNIYFEGVDKLPDIPIERDVEVLFMTIHMDGCEYDKAMLQNIEKGQYVDDMCFADRFGRILWRQYLSTGTKAALCLYHAPDVLIWGGEIGRNALAEMIKYCPHGNLLLLNTNYYVECELEDVTIDVICKGRHYTSLDEFSEYMMEDAPD